MVDFTTLFISDTDQEKIDVWTKDVYKRAHRLQLERNKDNPDMLDTIKMFGSEEYPYYGSIGGGLSYTIIPTSIGEIIKVKEHITGEELDLTDYASW